MKPDETPSPETETASFETLSGLVNLGYQSISVEEESHSRADEALMAALLA